MSWKPVLNRKETLIGHTDTARVIYPSLRASIRRNDPDGSSIFPYFSSLLGNNLIITIEGSVSATYNIGFTSNSYSDALAMINSTDPVNLKGDDDNGFLRVTNLNGGSKNDIKITGGSGAVILGFDVFPLPTGVSYAGEVSTTGTGWPYQINEQLTSLIAKDEGFQGSSFNRALTAIMTMNDSITSNQDREMAVPRRIDVTVSGGTFSITGLDSTERLFVSGNTLSPIAIPNPTLDTLDKYLVFLDRNDNQVFVSDVRVRISAVTYGAFVSNTTSFTTWGTPDGKSVFGNGAHLSKVKATGTIDNIKGNVLTVPGALFVTNKVQSSDTIIISGATNNIPFNHNGDFVIESVIDENNVVVRPKGDNDAIFDSANSPPAALNTNLQIGEIYGDVTIPIGRYLPFTMPGAGMVFTLSPAPADGNYRLIAPIGRTLRNILAEDITLSTISRPFGGQIELGSKLAGSGDGSKPRIISVPNPIDTYSLLLQSGLPSAKTARFFSTQDGRFVLTVNARWNGTGFVKDVNGEEAYKLDLSKTELLLHGVEAAENSAWTTGHLIASFKNNDQTFSTINQIGNGLSLGTEIIADQTKAIVPRIYYNLFNTANKYTALSLTSGNPPFVREFAIPGGDYIRTYNAGWSGTQWFKDLSGTSIKQVINKSGVQEFVHSDPTLAIANFTDSGWQTREIIKDYQFNEHFNEKYTSTGASTNTTQMVVSVIPTNVTHSAVSDLTPGNLITSGLYGVLSVAGTTSGAFGITMNSRVGFGTATRDFIIKTKLKVPNIGILGANSIFVGLICFNDTMPFTSNQFGVVVSNTDTTWRVRIDDIDHDTGITFTTDWTTFTIERVSGIVTVYINNQPVLTITAATSINQSYVEVDASGTATGTLQTALGIDYIKVWLADI